MVSKSEKRWIRKNCYLKKYALLLFSEMKKTKGDLKIRNISTEINLDRDVIQHNKRW